MSDSTYNNKMMKFFRDEVDAESIFAWGLPLPLYQGRTGDCWNHLYLVIDAARSIREYDLKTAETKLQQIEDTTLELYTLRLVRSWLRYETEPKFEYNDEIGNILEELSSFSNVNDNDTFQMIDRMITASTAHVMRIMLCSQISIPDSTCINVITEDIDYLRHNQSGEAILSWAQFVYEQVEAEIKADYVALEELSLKWIGLCAKWNFFGDGTEYVDSVVITYEDLGDKKSAVRTIDRALEICLDKEQFLIMKARKLRQHGDIAASSEAGRDLVNLFPESYAGYCLLTQSKWAENKTEEALFLAEDACRRFPESPDCIVNRAFIFFQLEEYDKALADFRVSVDCPQYRYDSQRGIGRCLVLLDREIEAIEHFCSISRSYKDADIYFELADLYMNGGWIDDAARMCHKCLELDDTFSGAYFHLASIADIMGNETEAVELYERTLAITPDHTAAMTALALLLQQEGNSERALELAEQALETTPDYADAMYAKGNILYYFGEFEEADKLFAQALDLIPDHVPALAGKGNSLVQLAEYDEAQIVLDQVLELDPDNLDACHGKLSLCRELGLEGEQQVWQKRIIMIENHIDDSNIKKDRDKYPDPDIGFFEDDFQID